MRTTPLSKDSVRLRFCALPNSLCWTDSKLAQPALGLGCWRGDQRHKRTAAEPPSRREALRVDRSIMQSKTNGLGAEQTNELSL